MAVDEDATPDQHLDRLSTRFHQSSKRARVLVSDLVPTQLIRVDGEVEEHVESMLELAKQTPPIVVEESTMRVIDGMHRLTAAIRAGHEYVEAIIFSGTSSEALLLAIQLNSGHGMPLSRADRLAAVANVLSQFPHWSDRAIASLTGTSPHTVAARRRSATMHSAHLHARVGKDGVVRPRTTAEGRQLAARVLRERPGASLREVAAAAGISVGTVRDVKRRLADGRNPVLQHPRPPLAPPVAADSAPTRTAAGGRLGEASAESSGGAGTPPALDALLLDPSLRYTEPGRALLRLLNATSTVADGPWRDLATGVPPHSADSIAAAARHCAAWWAAFADRIVNEQL
jgi:ParB-like chromosome segregation protein Spo0J